MNTRIERDGNGKGVVIRYVISEGSSALKDQLIIEGMPDDVPSPEIPKGPHSAVQANDYLQEIELALNDAAYLQPSIWLSEDADRSAVVYHVKAGEKTYVRDVEVEGNVLVETATIVNQLRVHPGDPWSPRKIHESRLRLLKLGLFSNIDIEERAEGDANQRSVTFKVKERSLQSLQLGAGLNSEYGLHLFAEGTDLSLFRDGRSLSLRLDGYYDSVTADVSQGVANLRYLDPALFNSNLSFAEDLRYIKQSLSTQEFDLNRASLSSTLYQVRPEGVIFSAGHTIFQENLDNVSPGAIIGPLDTGIVRISSLGTSLRYDQRDSALTPTKGYQLTLDNTWSSGAFGSDANYFAAVGRASYLQPLPFFGDRFVLAIASRLGANWKYGSTEEIPISQRYYAGGRTTVRGFGENSLGPKGYDDAVIGGDVIFVNNLQLNYLWTDAVSVHTFLDAGNVYLRDFGVDLGSLSRGAGFGVEYISPIGPIGIDLGFPAPRHPGEDVWRFYFTVGTLF